MTVYNVFRYSENPVAGIQKVFFKGFVDVKEAIEYRKLLIESNLFRYTIEVEY